MNDLSANPSPENNEENQASPEELSSGDDLTNIPATVPEDVKPILKSLPEEQQRKVVRAIVSHRRWRAPMPPPDILKEYNKCAPNGADRILRMTENQSEHRMRMEFKAIEGDLKQSNLGQIFAFIIAMSFLGVSGFLIYIGHEISGSILGTVDLVALVTAFLVGRHQQNRDLSDKNPKE